MLETLPSLWNFRIHSGRKWIFQHFSPFMQLWPKKLAPPISRCTIKSWQILCRYVCVFKKLNSINSINQNLSFCEKQFYRGNARLCFTKTVIVIDRVDGIWFYKDANISTWNLPTFCDAHKIRWRQFLGPKLHERWKLLKNLFPPEWILKFHKEGKVSSTDQCLSWKLVS